MGTDIGAKIGIDGEAAFRSSLSAINSQLKALGGEMKTVISAFSGMENSEEATAAKSDVLQRSIAASVQKIETLKAQSDRAKEKLSALADELENAKREFGENSEQALRAQNAYNRQVVAVNNLESQISRATTEMNRFGDEMRDLGNETGNLEEDFQNAGNGALTFGDVLKANVLSQAIISGVKAVASAVKDMAGDFIESAAAVKAESSMFEQTFGSMQKEASEAIGNVAENSGILETRLNTLGAQIFAFARSSGGNATESMDLMEKSLQATADAAAYYDRSLEDTAESMQSFLKGNFANDAALGVSCTETTRNAQAMELFGKKYNDLSEIQKQETLLQMVLDAQKLSGAMGQAAREADGWENVQGNLSEAWRQFQANVGAPFLEAMIPVIQTITEKLTEMTAGVDWTAFSESISGFVSAIVDNGSTIISLIAGIASGFLAWNVAGMISGVVTAVKAFQAANEGASVAQAILNGVMKANPIMLVATLVIGLVTALVTFIATNEEARAKLIAVWNAIKSGVGGAIERIKALAGELKAKFQEILEWFKGIPARMKAIGSNLLTGLWSGISDKVAWLKGKVRGVVDKIKSWFTGKAGFDTHSPSKWTEKIGGWVMDGLGNGFENNSTAIRAARKAANSIKDAITDEISKVNAEISSIQKESEERQAKEELEQYKENLAKKQAELKKAEPKNRKSILDEIAKIEKDWNKKQLEAAKQAEQKKLQERLTALQEFKQKYESELSAIESKQASLSDKLSDYGELFTRTKDEETGKEIFKLTNLDESIRKIQKYNEQIEKLKGLGNGISDGLLFEVAEMNIDDALDFAEELNKLAPEKFDEYVQQYEEKQKVANEAARQFYSGQIEELALSAVEQAESYSDSFVAVGKALTDGVADGVENGESGLINSIRKTLQAAVRAAKEEMDIHSPSGVFKEVGGYMAAGLDVGWQSGMRNVTRTIQNSLSSVTATSAALATGGISKSQTYTYGDINVHIDSVKSEREARVVAEQIEFLRRQQSAGRGGNK